MLEPHFARLRKSRIIAVISGIALAGCVDPSASRFVTEPAAEDTRALAEIQPVALDDGVQFSTTVALNVGAPGAPASRAIVGSNVQWVDGADDMVAGWAYGGSASTLAGTGPQASAGVPLGNGLASLTPSMFRAVEDLAPGALRFPGGTNADVYHWRGGVGSISSRQLGEHVFRRTSQRMVFGTGEFLALAQRLSAEPIITINVPTGTPAEAAQWVRAVNATGLANPDATTGTAVSASAAPPPGTPRRVHYWEIGNEPYLIESLRPELALTPSAFASRATAIIKAMKAVDPTIAVGLPLRLDVLGAAPVVHFPGYAETVLRETGAPVDFVALHNAYLPLVYAGGPGGSRPDDNTLFRATMSASRVVETDFQSARSMWQRLRPGQPLALAVTEYSAMYSLGGALDQYASSMGAALYVADVLRVFAYTPELKLSTQWSLSGNGIFGSLTSTGIPRAVYEVLRGYTRALRGRMLLPKITAPTFTSAPVGIVPGYADTPLVSATATLETAADIGVFNPSSGSSAQPALGAGAGIGSGIGRVRAIVQNKDVSRQCRMRIQLSNSGGALPLVIAVRAQVLAPKAGTSAFAVQELPQITDRWRTITATVSPDGTVEVSVPAQSLTFLELDLGTRPPPTSTRKRGLS